LFWHYKIPPLYFWLFSNLEVGIASNAIVGIFQVVSPLPWRADPHISHNVYKKSKGQTLWNGFALIEKRYHTFFIGLDMCVFIAVNTSFELMICNRNLIHSVTVHKPIFWLNSHSKGDFLLFHYHYFIICKQPLFGTRSNPKNILTDECAELRR